MSGIKSSQYEIRRTPFSPYRVQIKEGVRHFSVIALPISTRMEPSPTKEKCMATFPSIETVLMEIHQSLELKQDQTVIPHF